MRRFLVPLLLLLPVSSASAAGWSADRVQTRSGVAGTVHAAGGSGDRIALGWDRRLSGVNRAELRLGRARDGLRPAPQVLDSSPNLVEAPLPAYIRAGGFVAAWRRAYGGGQRIQYRNVNAGGGLSGKFNATTTGANSSAPTWTGTVLSWSRTGTRSDALDFRPTGPDGVFLPVGPALEPDPALASSDAGLTTAVFVNRERLFITDRDPSSDRRAFGELHLLAMGDVNRPRVARVGGATLVFWRQGVDLRVAARPADGAAFGPARTVLAETTDIAQVAVTGNGEVLVVAPVGDSSRVGALTLLRLGTDGAPLEPARVLGRGRLAQLAADGTGSAFVAWIGESATRAVTARRIASGGILGAPRVLAARSSGSPALAATREGGAVLAWVTSGAVHARTYRR